MREAVAWGPICLVLAGAWLYLSADLTSVSQGLDGTLYASIARFMAAGEGSFWFPPYFDAGVTAFHDHPPLGLWLQSLWFGVFGDSFWVEKLYSALLGLVICALLVGLWRDVTPSVERAWQPLLIFLLMPVSTYALKNNTLETLLTVTSLAAVWIAWRAVSRVWLNTIVGLLCLAGVLIKGPVALFVLGVPGCFAVFARRDWRRAFVGSAVATGVFCLGLALILLDDDARYALHRYFEVQLLASLGGERTIEHGRGYQLAQLSYNLLVAGIVACLAAWRQRGMRFSREFWAFLIIGLSAVLPLLISPRQYRHYLLPGLPFFAMAAALAADKQPSQVAGARGAVASSASPAGSQRQWHKAGVWAAVIIITIAATARGVSYYAEPGSHAEELADAEAIAAAAVSLQTGEVTFCSEMLRRRVYLARHHAVRSRVAEPGSAMLVVCGSNPNQAAYEPRQPLNEGLMLWERLTAASPSTPSSLPLPPRPPITRDPLT